MILFLVVIVLWIKVLKSRPKKLPVRCEPPSSTRLKEAQQEQDIEFWQHQLDRHYEMLWEADEYLNKAKQQVELDREMNKYGAVVLGKVEEQHHKEYQKWLKKVTTLEAQIYRLERKINVERERIYQSK